MYNGGAQRWLLYATPYDPPYLGKYRYLDATGNATPVDAPSNTGDVNWYLITKGNYAMTQTGHTTGACTPDEAKLIANMIYYTSTLNLSTTGEDRQVKDSAAPQMPTLTAADTTIENTSVTLNSKDNPTNYYYRVKTTVNNKTKYSDVIKQPVLSNIKGYIYTIDNSSTNNIAVAKNSAGEVTNITLPVANPEVETRVQIPNLNKYSSQYLHVVAVDRDNNVSAPITKQIRSLTSNNKTISGQVWQDQNYDGRLTINETGPANIAVNLFRKLTNGTWQLVNTVLTDSTGHYTLTSLKSDTYVLGLPIDQLHSWLPTVSGIDSKLLEQAPQSISSQQYSLTGNITLNNTNITSIQNLGLSEQLGFLAVQQVPLVDFGIHVLPYLQGVDLNNQSTTQDLIIKDRRFTLQQTKPDLAGYFTPYRVQASLSPFTHQQDHSLGLQGSTLILEPLHQVAVNLRPNGQPVILEQQSLPVQLQNITKFQRIHLKVPPRSSVNTVKTGKYQATLTYDVVNAP